MAMKNPSKINHSERAKWEAELDSEVAFWKSVIAGEIPQFSEDIQNRLIPECELSPSIANKLADFPQGSTIKILDVGSGPLTSLGKVLPGQKLQITAVDPLAEKYRLILNKAGITPPIWTIPGEAEKLTDQFNENQFDMVYSRNALDHSYDALEAIRQCLRVAKPNAPVILEHAVNEAERQRYDGLHQWNFSQENNQFILWNSNKRINVNNEFNQFASIEIDFFTDEWMNLTLRKKESA